MEPRHEQIARIALAAGARYGLALAGLAAGARYSLTGVSAADSDELGRDAAFWESRRTEIERAARVAEAFTTVEAVTAVETAES